MSIVTTLPPTPQTTLAEFVDEYASVRDLAHGSLEHLRYTVKVFDRWYGKPVRIEDLADAKLNLWLTQRIAAGTSRRTCRGQRGCILALWNEAAYLHLAPYPGRIKLPRVPCPVVEAWDQDTVRRIIETAAGLPGHTRNDGIPRGLLMRAICLVAWYSGLRPCDILALRAGQINAAGVLVTIQQKTNQPLKCTLPPEALEAIGATFPPTRERLFPIGRKALENWWKQLKKAAGVPGSFKWFRRSAATAIESEHPGSSMRFLGHRTVGLAWKHYIDLRLVDQRKPQPPTLGITPADEQSPTPEAVLAPLLAEFGESDAVEKLCPLYARRTYSRARRLVTDCKMEVLADVTRDAVEAFLEGMPEATSRSNHRRAIQAFAGWLIDRGIVTEDLQAIAVRKPGGRPPKRGGKEGAA